ncbi:hypothetical protein HG536_0B02210 [Torulaspora globosa]|uniref:Core domain-containing protein n=1 Tax=Torulaspora globosa TaxID=48254 RepID=A0A7G3ZCX2_9SACH|nr:uncharacterized protein HG536_0B02210 [Torulaspora globosa]QLL31358.1 hypothetical protein HG536_0B02210 [Torulaspora globosa]
MAIAGTMSWRLFNSVTRSFIKGSFAARGAHRCYSSGEQIVKPVRIINQPPGSEMHISERAFKRLSEIYRESKEVLKIAVESGGCHGFQYNMSLIPDAEAEKRIGELETGAPEPPTRLEGDGEKDEFDDDFKDNREVIFVLPEEGGKVLVDENSLKILNKTTLTYSTELIGSTFKITGGNLKSSCGCGSSFDVDTEQ